MKTPGQDISSCAMRALRRRKPLWRFLESLCRSVEAEGGEAYLVGGYVRDLVDGLPGKDVDLMVTGMKFGRLGAVLRSLPPAALGIRRIFPVGKAFAVYKVRTEWAKDDIDVALARTERSIGAGHREFEIRTEGVEALEDAARRDFTINSLMIALRVDRGRLTGRVQDVFGGLRDLRRRHIRGVGIPEDRFREDPLRMLRAIRQKNERRGYAIERGTREAIVRVAPELLRTISGERVIVELLRSLKSNPAGTVGDLRATGILPILLPEIRGRENEAAARMKRRYAVLERMLGSPLPETVLLANMLVDVALGEAGGKASGTVRGRTGLARTEKAARRLHFPQVRRVILLLADLARLDRPELLRHRMADIETTFGRWEDPRHLLAMHAAARKASRRKATDFRRILRRARKNPPLLTGNALIALGVAPGPRIERILEDVREATLEGRIASRKEAERFALELHGGTRPAVASPRERG